MVKKAIEVNETSATPIIEHCNKCSKKLPKMIKVGHAKDGKQIHRCMNCINIL